MSTFLLSLKALSNCNLCMLDVHFDGYPILQLLSYEMMYHQPVFKEHSFVKKKAQVPVQFAHVRLLDGNNNQFLGRFVVHLTAESRKLKTADIIKLETYTHMTNHVKDEPPKPSAFNTKFSIVGYNTIPDLSVINDTLYCMIPPIGHSIKMDNGPMSTEVLGCEMESVHVQCMVSALFVAFASQNPVDWLDLQMVKEDWYFTNKDLDQMTFSEKQCMIY